MEVDEIDDAAAHDAVEQVARRAPHDQRKGAGHHRPRAAREQHPEHYDRGGGKPVEHDLAHGRRERREQAERGARIYV